VSEELLLSKSVEPKHCCDPVSSRDCLEDGEIDEEEGLPRVLVTLDDEARKTVDKRSSHEEPRESLEPDLLGRRIVLVLLLDQKVANEHHREVAEDVVNCLLFWIEALRGEKRPKIMNCRMQKRKNEEASHLLPHHEEEENGGPVHIKKSQVVCRQYQKRDEGQSK